LEVPKAAAKAAAAFSLKSAGVEEACNSTSESAKGSNAAGGRTSTPFSLAGDTGAFEEAATLVALAALAVAASAVVHER
jgi:hypothetical protein